MDSPWIIITRRHPLPFTPSSVSVIHGTQGFPTATSLVELAHWLCKHEKLLSPPGRYSHVTLEFCTKELLGSKAMLFHSWAQGRLVQVRMYLAGWDVPPTKGATDPPLPPLPPLTLYLKSWFCGASLPDCSMADSGWDSGWSKPNHRNEILYGHMKSHKSRPESC